MLRSALWILQMAYLLLQSGPQAKAAEEAEAKEAEEKAAKKRATRKIVLMKAALEEDMNKVLLEGGPLTKGPSECPIEKGPLKTQVICTSYAPPPAETSSANEKGEIYIGKKMSVAPSGKF